VGGRRRAEEQGVDKKKKIRIRKQKSVEREVETGKKGGSPMISGPLLHLSAVPGSQCTHLEALDGRAEEARAWTATRRAVDGDDDYDEATAAPWDVFFFFFDREIKRGTEA
jgi:hypothetical protein